MKKTLIFSLILFSLSSTIIAQSKREMRAAWIATVVNIDWPSKKGMSTDSMKMELVDLIDKFKENNLNTVIFQARPCADAIYKSQIEPWSEYLMGKQGVAPDDDTFDPLHFIIEECHKRCMELHVWINPYRVLMTDNVSQLDSTHLYFKQPDLFVSYGKKIYFNPAKEETKTHLLNVVSDIVSRYDIDALHMDDYFYPYPIAGEKFPDEKDFKKNPRGFSNIGDWRRDNVNTTIRDIYRTIKRIKPWVDFGISPFGTWRHKSDDKEGSNTQKGLTNYDHLYADVLTWLKNGEVDYIAPQLYWYIGQKNVDYAILAPWWAKNAHKTNLYIGLYASSLGLENRPKQWYKPNELIRQINLNRKHEEIKGEMFYSAKYFIQNLYGLNDSLQQKNYYYPAIPPMSQRVEWRNDTPISEPTIQNIDKKTFLQWKNQIKKNNPNPKGEDISYYIIYVFEGDEIGDLNDAKHILSITQENQIDITPFIIDKKQNYTFAITTINKFRAESIPVIISK